MGRVHPRTRTGCLPCRQRKKKCDEVKPQCRACTRNKLRCLWPPHIIRIFGLDEEQENQNELHSCEESGSTIETQSNTLLPTLPAASAGPGAIPEGTEQVTSRRGSFLLSCNLEKSLLSTIPVSTLVSESPMLLSHYLQDTAPKLSPALDIPWVTWIMPVAYNDDLLMNAILALSGGHLLYKLPASSQGIRHATHRHYSSTVRCLRHIFNDESMLSKPLSLLRVTLAILILFHYEVVSGHLDGSPFMHLRATRQLVSNLQNVSSQISSVAERRLYGFVREVYSYIVSCNSITPFNMDGNRTLAHDSSLQGFDDLQNLGAFGVMFSGGHEIFELISSVSILAAKEPSLNREMEYRQLKARISTLEFPFLKEADAYLHPGCSQTLEVCRLALLVFLETTNSAFSKYDIDRIQELQPLLDAAVLELPQILPSKYSCIMMWPIIVIGSCLVKKYQRELISHMLLHNQYGMKNTGQAQMLLELLWCDPDEYAYGPYGLGLLMNRHKLHYGVI